MNVYLGKGAKLTASKSYISIGNKVMFGPNVVIRGGNHNTSVVGKFMYDVKEKRACDDDPVVISDDVWVGANVTILKGVAVGRGAIIAAGSVVTKNVPPYSIVAGVPGKVVKFRWEVEQVLEHEKKLYPQEERYGYDELVGIQKIHLHESIDNH